MNGCVLSVRRYLVLGLATTCCANVSLAQQGPPGGLGVTVLNTPLSVTGSTTVSGSVSATQSGPWTVQVVNPPTAAPVRGVNIDKDGRNPYQSVAQGKFCTDQNRCVVFFPAIPANRRLVV